MQTPSRTRKRFSPAQRQSILEAYLGSQRSQREFVAEAGIGLSTLHSWLRKAPSTKSASPSKFIQIPNPLSRSAGPAVYRLEFPRGVILEVRSGFPAGELGALVQMLQTL